MIFDDKSDLPYSQNEPTIDAYNDLESDFRDSNQSIATVANTQNSTFERFEYIPNELKTIPNWVLWKLEDRKDKQGNAIPGKPSKPPYQTNGKYASSDDKSTWCTFEQAVTTCDSRYNGIGFNLKGNSQEIIGIDVDHQFDSELSQEFITHFKNTYCEKSPSNKLRIFCTGSIPHSSRVIYNGGPIEFYNKDKGRYLTVTGNHIEGTGLTIEPCQDALDWAFNRFFSKTQNNNPLPLLQNPSKTQIVNNNVHSEGVLSDEQIIDLCRRAKNASKFDSLFNGGGNKDESSGDIALVGIFARCTLSQGQIDSNQIDRLMRLSNRANLKNGKWDAPHYADGSTYGQVTIDKVITNLKSTYSIAAKDSKPIVWQPEKDWHSKLACITNKQGTSAIKGNLYNMLLILRNDENLKGLFGFNQFTGKVEKLKMSLIVNLSEGELEDNDITRLRDYFSNSLKPINSHMVSWDSGDTLATIVVVAKENPFHPVRDYLNSLQWDDIERLGLFFTDHCGAIHNRYTDFVGKSLFISAVARIMQPGCKVDTVVILEGDQGLGKSTLFRSLCPDENWFRDSEIDLNTKDGYTGLREKWFIELAELDALNKTETTRIKSFITSQTDSYRPPYGKCDIDVPRQCIFVGTTNKSNYLKDETGNRRFLPVKCEWVDVDAIVAIRDQLWAEAVTRYNAGEKWWYDKNDKELFAEITNQQESRFEGDAWQLVIEEWASKQNVDGFTITFLAESILGFALKDIDRKTETRIGKILNFLGYKPTQITQDGKRKRVYKKLA